MLMKKFTALVVMLCFMLTMIPFPQMAQAASKEPPAGIAISVDDEGEVSISVEEDAQNEETLDWLKNVKQVIVDGKEYYNSEDGDKYYNFVVDQDNYTIELNKPILKKEKNKFKILATGYKAYEKTVENKDVEKLADMFKIKSIEEKTLGDETITKQALVISIEYGVKDSLFDAAFRLELDRISIDGKTYQKYASDQMSFLTPNTRTLQIYETYKEGRDAIERFRKSDKHEVIVYFKDGSKLVYRDKGYVAPEDAESPQEPKEDEEEDKPAPPSTGKMADGLTLSTFVKNTSGLGWKGVKMYSDFDRKEWYNRYYLKMRFVVIDDKEVIDLATSAGRENVKLDNEYLAIATYTNFYEPGTSHKIRVYFDDKSYVEKVVPGYKAPENPVDPFANESGNESNKASEYVIKDLTFKNEWGVDTLYFDFENQSKIIVGIADIMPKTTLIINGEKFSGNDVTVSKLMGRITINSENAIAALKKKSKATVSFKWPDGTTSTFEKDFGSWETMKTKYVIKDISVQQKDNENKVLISLENYKADEVKKSIASYGSFILNGEYFSADKFNFGRTAIESTDKDVWKALTAKKPASLKIKWTDGTSSEFTKNVEFKESETDKKVLTDEATKVQVTFDADAFDKTPQFNVKKLDKEALLKISSRAEKIYKEHKAADGYTFKLTKAADKANAKNYKKASAEDSDDIVVPTGSPVEFKIPLGSHDAKSLKVYAYNDTEGFVAIDNFEVKEKHIILKERIFSGEGTYVVASGDKGEEPIAPTDTLANTYKVTGMQASDYGSTVKIFVENYDSLMKKNKEDMLKAFKGATYRINGVEVKGLGNDEAFTSYDSINVNNENITKALKKNPKGPITITFSDKSKWTNGIAEEPGDEPEEQEPGADEYALKDKLPDGDYTVAYQAFKKGSDEESTIQKYFAPYAHISVKKGVYKITFLNTTMGDGILDFAVQSNGKYERGLKENFENDAIKKTFTLKISDLEKVHQGAILLTFMNGREGDIGDYDKYTLFDIKFTGNIKKGWKGFSGEVDEEKEKQENDELLTLKLLHEGVVDQDGDNKLSPQELANATGKLDLSGENVGKTSDVSMLKDLGPGVTDLYLHANGIKELPEGFFDKMTNLETIYVGGNKLTKMPKDAFKKNTALKEVSMSSNPFESLDENIFSTLTDLRILDLSESNLKKLPEKLLANNKKVKEVYFYDNQLKEIPEEILADKPQLYRLDLNTNKLEELPETISECPKLEYFWAYNNKLTAIPEGFSKLKHLYNIDLSNNYISKVPDSFWTRMSLNAAKKKSVESKLILSNNLIKDIPFKMMAEKGSKHFNNINVNLNMLKSDLTEQDIKDLKAAGVSFTDIVRNAYQPQKTIVDAKAVAKDGEINLTQDLDMVEASIWISADGLYDVPFFKDKDAFINYLDNTLKKQFNVRTIDRGRGAAEVFFKQEYDWKIHTRITKEDAAGHITTVYDKYSNNNFQDKKTEIDPIDGKNFKFEDSNMKKGDKYTLSKVIYTKKGAMPYKNTVSYRLNFTAGSDSIGGSDENPVEKMPFNVMHATKEVKSHAGDALNPVADVKVVNGKYEVILTAKAMEYKGIRGHVEKFFVYNDLEAMKKADKTKRQDVKVLSSYEENGKKYPEKISFTVDKKPVAIGMGAQVDVMDHEETEFRLVFGKNDVTPDQPKPQEEKAWEVPVQILQAGKDIASAANGAFGDKVLVSKTKNGYKYTFKTPKFVGMTGSETWLTKLHVYRDADAQAIKDETEFTVVSKENNRWTSIAVEFEDKLNVIPVTLQAEGMPFEADARVMLDWKKATVIDVAQPGDEPQEESAAAKELKALIAEANDKLDNGKVYTESSKKAVEKAIEAAQKALKDKDDAACKKAAKALSDAMSKLTVESQTEESAVVKDLDKAIENAQAKLRDGKTYTEATKEALENALSKAKAARRGGKDADMQKATKVLNEAIKGLKLEEKTPETEKDMTKLVQELNKLIKKAEYTLESDREYTKSSRRALRAAIVRAQDAIEDKDVSAMEDALKEVQAKYSALKRVEKDEEVEEKESKKSKKSVVYSVDVMIKHATKDKDSMANDSIYRTAKVVEKDDKATYTVYFKPMKKDNIKGEIKSLTVNGKKAKVVDGTGSYDKGFTFSRNKLREKEIPVTFEIDALGGMEQDARLVFDWSSRERIDEDDDVIDDEKETKKEKEKELKKNKEKTKDVLKKAYIHGYADNTFKPDRNVTRAEAATMLANFIDESTKHSNNMLKDVHTNAWYYDSVQKLVDAKVLGGYPDGGFYPNRNLTRAELVTLVAKLKGIDTGSKSFKDVKSSHWAANAISACADAGYVSGYPSGDFMPDKQITRAEIVVVMNRVFDIPVKDSNDNTFKDVSASHWAYTDIQKAANN